MKWPLTGSHQTTCRPAVQPGEAAAAVVARQEKLLWDPKMGPSRTSSRPDAWGGWRTCWRSNERKRRDRQIPGTGKGLNTRLTLT